MPCPDHSDSKSSISLAFMERWLSAYTTLRDNIGRCDMRQSSPVVKFMPHTKLGCKNKHAITTRPCMNMHLRRFLGCANSQWCTFTKRKIYIDTYLQFHQRCRYSSRQTNTIYSRFVLRVSAISPSISICDVGRVLDASRVLDRVFINALSWQS